MRLESEGKLVHMATKEVLQPVHSGRPFDFHRAGRPREVVDSNRFVTTPGIRVREYLRLISFEKLDLAQPNWGHSLRVRLARSVQFNNDAGSSRCAATLTCS
jgi:hypothetical protein